VSVTLPLLQITGAFGEILALGKGCTLMKTVAVLVQPYWLVPVTVYVVVVVGVATGFAQVVQLSPVAGAQLYELTPDAVMFTLLPLQMPITEGMALTVVPTFTTTVSLYVLHPPTCAT
jgi:hypothetical protein